MMILVIGGSGSGKSAYAESRILSLDKCSGETQTRSDCLQVENKRIYLATMENFGKADQARIDRHRYMRAGKGFTTVERTKDLAGLQLPEGSRSVLLECITSLVGNELYHAGGDEQRAYENLCCGIDHLQHTVPLLVVVTDNVFCDGITYDEETTTYIGLMGRINRWLAGRSDEVVEVVCSIPVRIK